MVTVQEVRTQADLKRFIRFEYDLYRDEPNYTPPLFTDELFTLDKKKNPVFEYADMRAFLALREGRIVGRVAGIINHADNRLRGYRRMRISHMDFVDDLAVSSALVKAVQAYAREAGLDELHGPLGFCDLDKEGMLVEGFDLPNTFVTLYNYPYYVTHFEQLGFTKSVDWVEHRIKVPKEPDPKVARIADIVAKRLKLHVLEIKKTKELIPHVPAVFELLDEAYKDLYGTVPITKKQQDAYVKQFFSMLNIDYVPLVFDEAGELVAFGIAVPSMSAAMRRCRGRLFPFGFLSVLRALKHNDVVDLYLVAVKPELQGKGVNALLINYVLNNAIRNGVVYAESNPELEENEKVQSQWKFFEREQVRRRRCWIKPVAAE